jgi:diguanylate cyclase (GGDEF)-like protein/PAS domain S-box-containing protein
MTKELSNERRPAPTGDDRLEIIRHPNGADDLPLEPSQPAEAALGRAAFLVRAGRLLASSMDYEATLAKLARLAVPDVADWCAVDLVEEGSGSIRRLALAQADPAMERLGRETNLRHVPSADDHSGPLRVIRTGESELVPAISDALPASSTGDDERLALLRETGFSSYMSVPLSARGSILGAITCIAAGSGRHYSVADLMMLEDLARTASVAVDSALLFHDLHDASAETEKSHALLDSLFATAPVGLAFWDTDLRYVRINESLAVINGLPVDAHLGKRPSEIHGTLGDAVEVQFRQVLETGEPLVDIELAGEIPSDPGICRSWVACFYPVLSPTHERLGIGAVVTDVTEGRRAAEALRESEERFRLLVEGVEDYAIYMVDPEGCVVSWNQGAEHIKGYGRDEVVGCPMTIFYTPEDVALGKPAEDLERAAAHGRWSEDRWRVRKDGSRFWANSTFTALRDDDGYLRGFCHVTHDITERKDMEERLANEAFHDSLTGLANRALFRDRIEHALSGRGHPEESIAVMFMDLDGFKRINDTLGHDAGDKLLATVADRLRDLLRPLDTAARLGGDEFGILLEDIHSERDAARVAERVLDVVSEPCELEGTEAVVKGSVGVVSRPSGMKVNDILRNADLAMYKAKEAGKGRYRMFEASMQEAVTRRLELENDLRRALDAREFVLYYQPIVDLGKGSIVGLEALLRWQHPKRGLVPPARFIDVAEETGLTVPLGWWVLREACRRGGAWQRDLRSEAPLVMSVNLSTKQFAHPDLVEELDRALRDSGIRPDSLVLEITEGLLMDDIEATIERLDELKGLGVRLAIDDFGSGYSSLSALRRLPVDIVKIDQSFVGTLGNASQESALTDVMIKLSATLHLEALAKGIEKAEQVDELRDFGCRRGQGYGFSEPLSAQEIEALLKRSELALVV